MGDALRKKVFTFSQNGRSRSPEYAQHIAGLRSGNNKTSFVRLFDCLLDDLINLGDELREMPVGIVFTSIHVSDSFGELSQLP